MTPELDGAIYHAAARAENYVYILLQSAFGDAMRGPMKTNPAWGNQILQITREWLELNTPLLDPKVGAAMAAGAGGAR